MFEETYKLQSNFDHSDFPPELHGLANTSLIQYSTWPLFRHNHYIVGLQEGSQRALLSVSDHNEEARLRISVGQGDWFDRVRSSVQHRRLPI